MARTSKDTKRLKADLKITQYLHEAHAAELATAQMLTAHIAMTPASRYRDGLETHLKETKDHAERIQRHLSSREAERGIVQVGYGFAQTLVGQVVSFSKVPLDLVRGMSGEEKLLRNARDECANEALEIAMYTALEQLARELEDDATERLAASIKRDEERMLERLLTEIPRLTTDVVSAEVDGNPQFVASRTGAVDVARSLASNAAGTLARSASTTAKRMRPVASTSRTRTGRTPRKPASTAPTRTASTRTGSTRTTKPKAKTTTTRSRAKTQTKRATT